MKKDISSAEPLARREGLVVQELPDEILVYDRARDRAHCLNQTAALVWKYCDGQTSVAKMALRLEKELDRQVDEKVVWFALSQLNEDFLLEEPILTPTMLAGLTRRQLVKAMGAAAIVAIPLVTSIVAPTPAQAATCLPSGAACTASAQCCSGLCTGQSTCA